MCGCSPWQGRRFARLQPGRARKPERKNVFRAEKGKPLHTGSCLWKPRRKQKRCKPVVSWLEITKESRLGSQGGSSKGGMPLAKDFFENRKRRSFSLTRGENSKRHHELWKTRCRFLTCWVPGPLARHFTRGKPQELCRFARGVRSFFSLLGGTRALWRFGKERVPSGVSATLAWRTSFSAG